MGVGKQGEVKEKNGRVKNYEAKVLARSCKQPLSQQLPQSKCGEERKQLLKPSWMKGEWPRCWRIKLEGGVAI